MAKFITIGVAGHTGHGKTTLVRSLTGMPADIMEGEKQHGAGMESGVFPLSMEIDIQAALMDTPGHIRYLKNTIRGLCSVDMGILVIAADDGIMPQTREHLNVFTCLGINHGFIVLSRTDLVDEELLELAELEIQEAVEGTLFEGKPVIPFSMNEPESPERIRTAIQNEVQSIQGKSMNLPFRMWVDRVRSIAGFGTVACGTICSGQVSVDDGIRILPENRESRARTLEVHHRKVSQALAGQRVGINLPKVSIQDVRPGMMLSASSLKDFHRFFNVELHVFRPVQNGQRVRLHLGTASGNAMVVLMETANLNPGGTGLAQLRLEDPIPAIPHDRFIICSLNLHTVMGGGTVLEISEYKFKSARLPGTLPYLKAVRNRDIPALIAGFCRQRFKRPVTKSEIAEYSGLPVRNIQSVIQRMTEQDELLALSGEQYYLMDEYRKLYQELPKIINRILTTDPFKGKTNKEAIRKHLTYGYDELLIKTMLQELHNRKMIFLKDGMISAPMETLTFSRPQKQMLDSLLRYSDEVGIPFSIGGFCRIIKKGTRKEEAQAYLDFLQFQGKLIRLNDDCYISSSMMEEIKKKVAQAIREKGSISVTDSKDIFGYGRTKGAPVLEYLDEIGFTSRKGDERILMM
ncbi:MAG: selenocysteine-specific translation elongation factor [Pseudomonadota bacterium]